MSDGEVFGFHPILAHEQPTRETLLDFVQTIAGGNLGDLQTLNQDEAVQDQTQFWGFLQPLLERVRLDAERRPGNLHDTAVRSALQAYGQRGSNNSLVADDGNFHATPIASEHDQRGQPFIQEIRKLHSLAGFVEYVAMGQLYELKFRPKAVVLTFRD
jgi:hypothetical protein